MVFTISLTVHEANEVDDYLSSHLVHLDIKAHSPAVHSGLLKICGALANNRGADSATKSSVEAVQSDQE